MFYLELKNSNLYALEMRKKYLKHIKPTRYSQNEQLPLRQLPR